MRLFPVTNNVSLARRMIERFEIGMHDYDDCDHAEKETIFSELVWYSADPRCTEFAAALVLGTCNGEIAMDTARELVEIGRAA